jgi:WD40 repeat protein
MLLLKDTSSALSCLAFSPDGTLLAAGTGHGVVQLWDATGALKAKLGGARYAINDVFFLPGGTELLALNMFARSWPVQRPGSRGRFWQKLGSTINRGALTADGQRLCLYCWGAERCSLTCCTVPDCKKTWREAGSRLGNIMALAFSEDGRVLATGDYLGEVVLRDAATGAMKQRIAGDSREIRSIALSPDGRLVAFARSTHLHLWRLDPPTELAHHCLGRTHFLAVTFHPSGSFLASANGDGKVDFWDAHTGEHRAAWDWKIGKLHDVVFDATGDRAACCSSSGQSVIWDVDE